jgi:CheY-like chemotaxis protein
VTFSILVVDDDDAFRGLASRMIAGMRLGRVAEAATVATALAAAVELRPCAALVDVGLPDGDGVTLATELSSLPWAPRIVLTSSDPDAVSPASAVRAGAVGFVPKEDLASGKLRAMLEGT